MKRNPTSRWLITGAAVMLLIGLVWFVPLSAQSPTNQNLHYRIYAKSIENMSRPDRQGDDVVPVNADEQQPALAAAAASRTCSQRCSQRCSVTCTTTRGCSSNCKQMTDGCGGAPSDSNRNVTTKPTSAGKSTPVRSAGKFTVRDVQMMLIILGYDVTPDGTLGEATHAAIQRFEKSQSLAVTGEPSSVLWQALCLEALKLSE